MDPSNITQASLPPKKKPKKEDNRDLEKGVVFFIAVHVGAGFHAEENSSLYKKSMKRALKSAKNLIFSNPNSTAVDVVEMAITSLELDPLTNAGMGANLTTEGTVECDASIMDGKNTAWFGGVGAISGVKNPVKVARKILDQRKDGLSLGRVPPMILAGEGATKFAESSGIPIVNQSELITEKSKMAWQRYSVMIQNECNDSNESNGDNRYKSPPTPNDSNNHETSPTTIIYIPNSSENPSQPITLTPSQQIVFTPPQQLTPLQVSSSTEELKEPLEPAAPPIMTIQIQTHQNSTNPSPVPIVILGNLGVVNPTQISPAVSPAISCTTGQDVPAKRKRDDIDDLSDTVGAICMIWRKCECSKTLPGEWCECGHSAAAGVSSGGILMKFPGRIGEAAMYGCGCWAEQKRNENAKGDRNVSVACSTTGTGEQIMQSFLARNCANCLFESEHSDIAIKTAFENFLNHQDLKTEKFGGLLGCFTYIDDGALSVEGIWAHTTESMGVGYYASGHSTPKTFITRLPTKENTENIKPPEPGLCVSISSSNFNYTRIP